MTFPILRKFGMTPGDRGEHWGQSREDENGLQLRDGLGCAGDILFSSVMEIQCRRTLDLCSKFRELLQPGKPTIRVVGLRMRGSYPLLGLKRAIDCVVLPSVKRPLVE
jgi:hypothetical protein